MKKTILILGILLMISSMMVSAGITDCDAEVDDCTDCDGVFVASTSGWYHSDPFGCFESVGYYIVNEDIQCDNVLSGEGDCAYYSPDFGTNYYVCPSYTRNGNVAVTTGDCICSGTCSSYDLFFDLDYEFFSGVAAPDCICDNPECEDGVAAFGDSFCTDNIARPACLTFGCNWTGVTTPYQIDHPFSGDFTLTDPTLTVLTGETSEYSTLTITHNYDGNGIHNIVVFNTDATPIDLSLVTANSDDYKVVVDGLDSVSGVVGKHSVYVNNDLAGAYVCPGANTLNDVFYGCTNMAAFTHGECDGNTEKTAGSDTVTCTDEGYYKISGLTGSGAGSACSACSQCDNNQNPEGLFCDFRDVTPTCKNKTTGSPTECVDCVDNDLDLDIDYPADSACLDYTTASETDAAAIPEFSTVGLIMALAMIGISFVLIKRKK